MFTVYSLHSPVQRDSEYKVDISCPWDQSKDPLNVTEHTSQHPLLCNVHCHHWEDP